MTPAQPPWQALRQRWEAVSRTPDGEPLVSPCVSVCTMQVDMDECQGCLRSIDEIAHWGMSTSAQQRLVWQRLGERIQQHFHKD